MSELGYGSARDRSTFGKIMNVCQQLVFVNWAFISVCVIRGGFSLRLEYILIPWTSQHMCASTDNADAQWGDRIEIRHQDPWMSLLCCQFLPDLLINVTIGTWRNIPVTHIQILYRCQTQIQSSVTLGFRILDHIYYNAGLPQRSSVEWDNQLYSYEDNSLLSLKQQHMQNLHFLSWISESIILRVETINKISLLFF